MRLKPAPPLRTWETEEERRRYDSIRRRGRGVVVVVGIVAAWAYAPEVLAPRPEVLALERRVMERSVEVTRQCEANRRAEDARLAYAAALGTKPSPAAWAAREIRPSCPRTRQRVLTDMPLLGSRTASEAARDIEESWFTVIEGAMGSKETASARVAGLISLANEDLIADDAMVRAAIAKSTWRDWLNEMASGPWADGTMVSRRAARDHLAATVDFLERKLEPVVRNVIGGRAALVEATVALAFGNTTDPNAREDGTFGIVVPLQETSIENVAPAVPAFCVRTVPAGTAIFTRVAPGPPAQLDTTLSLRLSYVDRDGPLAPSSAYVHHADRLDQYLNQGHLEMLRANHGTLFYSADLPLKTRAKAALVIASDFFKTHATETFYVILMLVAASAIVSLRGLVHAERATTRRIDDDDDDDDDDD